MLFAGKAETSAQIAPRPLRLTRLSEDRNYRIDLVNHADAPALSRGDQAIKSNPLNVSGGLPDEPRVDPAVEFPGDNVGREGFIDVNGSASER